MALRRPHDLALRLKREGYRALAAERLHHDDPDAFAARMLGRRTAVVRGTEGARLFYDTSRVRRTDAMPAPLSALLFGRGAVHGLDGEEHAERKAMFLELLSDERTAPLAAAVGEDLRRRAQRWRGRTITVFDELAESYGTAVLGWAGIDVSEAEARRWSHRLVAIVDGFGLAGAAYARGWAARVTADRWAARLVEDVRHGRRPPSPDSALALIASTDLSARVAGVELLNILRPTVAVAWPGTFAVLALAMHPERRESLRGDDAAADRARIAFGHEVRRLYPFVPALAGRLRCPVKAGPVELEEGDRIVLDVVGTDQDPQLWHEPHVFEPDRFLDGDPDPFSYVPQGGGDPATGHRCPGEPLTARLLAETVGACADLDLTVVSRPAYDARRMPTRPDRGLVVSVGAQPAP